MDAPSRAVRFYGTDETVEPPRLLKAATFRPSSRRGNLRYIRFRALRCWGVSFIVRDPNWAIITPRSAISRSSKMLNRSRVSYDAVTRDAKQGAALTRPGSAAVPTGASPSRPRARRRAIS